MDHRHVPTRLLGLLLVVTTVLPALALAGGTDRFGGILAAGFLIMATLSILGARMLLVYLPDSYLAAVVTQLAQAYLTCLYLTAFGYLAYWLILLGVGSGFAVGFSGALAVVVLVAYVRWLKPWLTKRNLRPLSFLDD